MELLMRIGLGILFTLIIGGAFVVVVRALSGSRIGRSLRNQLFLVRIPQEYKENATAEDRKNSIERFEQLLSSFSSFQKPFAFEVTVPHIGEEIHFYVAVPREVSASAVKHIQGLWNGASVEYVKDDYNIFNPEGETTIFSVQEEESYVLPLRLYEEMESDPLGSILSGFTKVNEVGEGAALQLVISPAGKDLKKHVVGVLNLLRKGELIENALRGGRPSFFTALGDALHPSKDREEKEEKKKVVDETLVREVEKKAGSPLFHVNLRIVASAASKRQADDIAEGIASAFKQHHNTRGNSLKIVTHRNERKTLYRYIFRALNLRDAMVLSSKEIAGLYHFPTPFTETPKVKWLKSKEAPPPVELPEEGTVIGESNFRGEKRMIRITEDDRKRHIYIIGQTGTGKSYLIANMAINDIQAGKGVAMIDPHGDLVEDVLSHVPRERLNDVIYFNPGDLERPLGLNMLDYNYDRPEERTFIVNEMQGIFAKLFPESGEALGPMFQQYMRNSLLLLMEDMPNEPATMVEVPRIFTDTEFRMRKLARIHNPVVIDFWEKEAIKVGGEASLANMTPYITSKFNNFIANDYMRPIIGQAKSAFNFREAMDQGKILLVNLSKGRIGDINANLLGMIITGKLLMAALSRVDVSDVASRRDFYLYIDEFQNFTTDSISTILSEARKYGLNLTLAHQFIGQLTESIRDSVFGNVGTQIVFRVGVQDAEFLLKQFAPTFNENDLVNIDNKNAYTKLLIRGQTTKPFNIKTLPRGEGDQKVASDARALSRERYGANRAEVEEEIRRRLRE